MISHISGARLGGAVVFLALAAVAFGQNFAVIQKRSLFVQTGATTTAPDGLNPFQFSATIDGTATNPAPPNTITLPNNGGARTLTFSPSEGAWGFEQSFTTLPAMNAAFPNGTYGFTVSGRNVSLALTGDGYPAAPTATLSQGTHAGNGTVIVDRTQPLTIAVSYGAGFVPGSSRLAIYVNGPSLEREATTDASLFTQNQVSLALAANTLGANGLYTVEIEANRIVQIDTTSVPGLIVGTVYTSRTRMTLAVAAAPGAPTITVEPVSQTVSPGSTVVLSVAATNATSYEWRRDGAGVPNGNVPTLVLSGANVVAGNYSVTVGNASGNVTSRPAMLTVQPGPDVGRLVNLAIRTNAGTGADTLIVGFAVGGVGATGEKPLLVRGVGPSLGQFGLEGVLADPVATVFQGGTTIATNDDWAGNPLVAARATQVAAFGLMSNASRDAALAGSPLPGSYSVVIEGKNGGTGIALAEIYDASVAATADMPRLVNVSARTRVGAGDDVLIAGFVVGGSTSRTVLIRALGPALTPFGVTGALADPRLQLFASTQMIRENDNWGGDGLLASTGNNVGAFEITDRQSRDAMLLLTLPPGSYTAQVSGANSGTGVALVEVYEVP